LIRELLEQGIFEGVFVGAQAAVCPMGGEPEIVCAGRTCRNGGEPVEKRTLFDVASLTKLFLCSAILRLADEGRLNIDIPLAGIFSRDVLGDHLAGVTIAQLLAHEAGLKAWEPFFERVDPQLRGTIFAKNAIVKMALTAPVEGPPGVVSHYSDLGYIILGSLLFDITGASLESLIASQVTIPLNLNSIVYRPLKSNSEKVDILCSRIAATEVCSWRAKTLVGEVHDDNAWTMGGVAGHAGLFGTARDVAQFGAAWLETINSGDWLSTDLALRAVSQRQLGRGLGWDMVTPGGSSAGSLIADRAFGHLGFTGCSLWVDPDASISIALLTNRVHPSRDNNAIRAFRPRFHDKVMKIKG